MGFNNISKRELEENLYDAGCDSKLLKECLDCYENEEKERQMMLIKKQRCTLLEKIHIYQKQIDCLDYLIVKLRKIKIEKGK